MTVKGGKLDKKVKKTFHNIDRAHGMHICEETRRNQFITSLFFLGLLTNIILCIAGFKQTTCYTLYKFLLKIDSKMKFYEKLELIILGLVVYMIGIEQYIQKISLSLFYFLLYQITPL